GGPGVRDDRAVEPVLHAEPRGRRPRPLRRPSLGAGAGLRPRDPGRGPGRRPGAPRRLRPRQRRLGRAPPDRGPGGGRRGGLPSPRAGGGSAAARLLAHRRGAVAVAKDIAHRSSTTVPWW